MASIVCVTGCSGYLGSWVVKTALDAGFKVRGTTRSAGKADFLKQLAGAAERLQLFAGCDLNQEGSFDEAISGCDTVIHTASPFFRLSSDDGRDRLVKPAVTGTRVVLDACARLGVHRVVLTSSTAATFVSYGTKPAEHEYSENDWSDEALLEEKSNWYCLSKVKAEKLAWELSQKEGCPYKLAVMNPCLILGPMLPGQTHLNTSCSVLLAQFGKEAFDNASTAIVDVRDVARAHVNAAQMPLDWSGWGQRFQLIGAVPMMADVVAAMRGDDDLPQEKWESLPTEAAAELPPAVAGAPPPHVTRVNVQRSLKPREQGGLGLDKYVDTNEMVVATVQSMLANGFDSADKYSLQGIE